jgi:hypothetical protein
MSYEAIWAGSLGISESQLNEWKALAEGHPSFLIWCLENQKIDEDNYVAWAQKHYQISHLKSDFFKSQPLPFELFDQYFNQLPKDTIPVTLWDGVLFIASPTPLPELNLDRPHQWVLASWIQIVNWRNQYEKELNAKSNGTAALSSLDFGGIGGNTAAPPSDTPVEVTKSSVAVPEPPAVNASQHGPKPTPPAVELSPTPQVIPLAAAPVKPSVAATPSLRPPSVSAKPMAVPTGPIPAKINPLPKVAPPPSAKPAPEVEKTVIQTGGPRPTPGLAQPRPSSTQTRSSIPLQASTLATPQKPTSSGAPIPAATNRPMPQAVVTPPTNEQTNTKIPRAKTPLGTDDDFTKTGFSKTAMSQTKMARVKVGNDNDPGVATAVRVQRPATTGVVVMDPRFKIDHPKYLKSMDDLPYYLLHRLRDLYDKTMILTFTGGILKPWRWDDSWGHSNNQTQIISVEDASMFRIPIQTKTPYHGHIVKSPVHDLFLAEWCPKVPPEHVTVLPMIVNEHVTGLILGVVKKNKVSRIRLEDVESIATEAGHLMMTLPSRVSNAA